MSIKNIVISFFLLFNFYCFASSGDIQNNKNSFLIKNTIMHGAKKIYSFLNHHSLLIGISSLGIGIYYYDKYKNNSSIINFGIQYQTQLATIGSFIISPIYIKWLNQYINDTEYKLMPKAQNFIDSKAIDLAKVIPTNIFELHLNKYKKKIKYIKQYQLKNMRHMSTKAAFNSIIYGPPGSGKTLLIQYLAKNIFSNETHTIYYKNISPTDILRTHISRDIEEIKKLENEIKNQYNFHQKNEPEKKMVIFLQFDEADTLFRARSSVSSDNVAELNRSRLNSFLTMIDQFKAQTKYDVFFMLTTNNLSLIDNAIIRTGRVENHIELELPDKENKINYAKQYIERANKLSDGFKYEELSDKNLELLTDKLATYADIDNEFASLTDLALDQDIAELTNEAFKNYYEVLHEENLKN